MPAKRGEEGLVSPHKPEANELGGREHGADRRPDQWTLSAADFRGKASVPDRGSRPAEKQWCPTAQGENTEPLPFYQFDPLNSYHS